MDELEKKVKAQENRVVAELEARVKSTASSGLGEAISKAASSAAGPLAEVAAHQILGKLGSIGGLPTWIVPAANDLIVLAERTFGKGNGGKKKTFVRAALLHLAETHDIKWLPDAIEKPLEKVLIDFLIEICFSWLSSSDLVNTPSTLKLTEG